MNRNHMNAIEGHSFIRGIPRGVWALGFVSLFMDFSSEMIHAVLPLFLVSALGASVLTVGIIEGIAEATANITKIFSGALSDWLGKRKLLAVIGYGLAAITKPIFPLASTIGWVIAARFLDRVGKGIRGAPRDALVADITPTHLIGASYGLRQSLDTVGAFLGPATAIALMLVFSDNFKIVFWVAVIPAFIAVAVLVFAVREPAHVSPSKPKSKLSFRDVSLLPTAYWAVVAVCAVLTLARFSEAFLILRSQNVGMPLAFIPAVLIVMNLVYAISAYPAGVLSDRWGRKPVLCIGIVTLIIADLVLASSPTLIMTLIGVGLWGLHMGLTQGLFSSLVADTSPSQLRGTAFGLLNLASGLAMLAASVIAGGLWDSYGPSVTFLAGAGFSALSLLGMFLISQKTTALTQDDGALKN